MRLDLFLWLRWGLIVFLIILIIIQFSEGGYLAAAFSLTLVSFLIPVVSKMIFSKLNINPRKWQIVLFSFVLFLLILATTKNPKSLTVASLPSDTASNFGQSNEISSTSLAISSDSSSSANSKISNTNTLVYQDEKVFNQRSKTSGCVGDVYPDFNCSPGAILPVTKEQICVSGYSASVRNVPESEKNAVYTEYGITTHTAGQYEIDHIVSLELGGSNDISNLWPEPASPVPGFHEKDKVENYLHKQVCSGSISLSTAQYQIAHEWVIVYQQMGSANSRMSTATIDNTTQNQLTISSVNENNTNTSATARCKDGTYSFAVSHRGACSKHGGVSIFYK